MIVVLIVLLLILLWAVGWAIWISRRRAKTQVLITPADYQLQAQTVSLRTTDGVDIEGWFLPHPHATKTVILVHGFGMNKGEMLKRTHFLALSYNLLYLDCRGAGESSGHSEAGLQESKDIQAAVDYLRTVHPSLAQEMALYGISMGAAAAAYYTATHGGIKCLVLEASYYSFKNVVKRWIWKHAKIPYFPLVTLFVYWKELMLKRKVESFALQQTASQITCPVLMIQGEKDKLAPVSKAQKTYHLLSGPKELWIVPQAGHASCYQFGGEAYVKKITQFFQTNL